MKWDAHSIAMAISQSFEHDDRACRTFACWDCRMDTDRWADDGGGGVSADRP